MQRQWPLMDNTLQYNCTPATLQQLWLQHRISVSNVAYMLRAPFKLIMCTTTGKMQEGGVLIRSLIILSQPECRGARHFLLSRVMQKAVLHVMKVFENFGSIRV
jgi:hypothetical protein